MLKATLAGDAGTMAEILKLAHDTKSLILTYNSEIELAVGISYDRKTKEHSCKIEVL